ncbi:hypothetical protein [Actinomadura rudentiformis]|uniref:IDEAL domain-containing protein n=1 Tax=Actinomadura rudentiformis TaxID=359158 RepID=A0A6H9YX15_9ACTN|nr:hypothetical protein [Actinomadura rudentiformis]KAB2344722.1 hypothetical protein F8566_29355 [Actinomadura rudentiformis]
MNNSPGLVRQLLQTVVAYTWFFETCDDSVLDDRTALKQMEYASYLLNQLADEEKQRLVEELAALAAAETDPAYRKFLQTFAFDMGITED